MYVLLVVLSNTSRLTYIQTLKNKFHIREFEANGNNAMPEARLPPMMAGSVSFPAGIFIMWLAPVIGLVSTVFGFFIIFQVY